MNPQFSFKYIGITDEQFAVFPKHFQLDSPRTDINIQLRFSGDFSIRSVGCEFIVDFASPQHPTFLRCAITCIFQFGEASWSERLSENKDFVTLEESIFMHFAAFTAGTIRGVLHVRQQNSTVSAILPPVNVVPLVKDMTDEDRIFRAMPTTE